MKKATNPKAGVRSFVMLILLFCFSSAAFSQDNQITVQGKVRFDSANLENVSIQLKSNPARATRTDAKGAFSLRVPANGTLLISHVGYESQEVAINGQSDLSVLLKPR